MSFPRKTDIVGYLPSFGYFIAEVSDCAGNFTRTQTAGTNIYMAGRTIDNCLNAFDVGLPRAICTTMRVGHLDTKGHALIAKLALCHPLHLLAAIKSAQAR